MYVTNICWNNMFKHWFQWPLTPLHQCGLFLIFAADLWMDVLYPQCPPVRLVSVYSNIRIGSNSVLECVINIVHLPLFFYLIFIRDINFPIKTTAVIFESNNFDILQVSISLQSRCYWRKTDNRLFISLASFT